MALILWGFQGVSSIESYDDDGKVNYGEKVPCNFVAVGGDGPELLVLAEEIFDEITCLVEIPIVFAQIDLVAPRREDSVLGGCLQSLADACRGVESLVRDMRVSFHLRPWRVSTNAIMGLPRRQDECGGLPRASTKAWILVPRPPRLRPQWGLTFIFFLALLRWVDGRRR